MYLQVWGSYPPWTATTEDLQLLQGIRSHAANYGAREDYYGRDRVFNFTLRDLLKLLPGNYLNEDLINTRVRQLNARTSSLLQQGIGIPQLLCFDTWLMQKLLPDERGGSGYTRSTYQNAAQYMHTTAMRRSISSVSSSGCSILGCQQLLTPCFIPSAPNAVATEVQEGGRVRTSIGHWVLLLADMRALHVYIIDPLQVKHCIPAQRYGVHSMQSCHASRSLVSNKGYNMVVSPIDYGSILCCRRVTAESSVKPW